LHGAVYRAFPEPAALTNVSPDFLERVVGNRRNARYLAAVAAAFCDADEASLRAGTYDEVETCLRAINGSAESSAAVVLVRGLGRLERIPLAGANLAEVAARCYGADDQGVLREAAGRYGAWVGYWAHNFRVAG